MSVKNPSAADREIGHNVRFARLQKGLSQTALAGRLGVTFQQVQKYEKGVNRIGSGRLSQIATILDVPVVSLFPKEGTNDQAPSGQTAVELLQTALQLRMATAFSRIKSLESRQHLVGLAEALDAAAA